MICPQTDKEVEDYMFKFFTNMLNNKALIATELEAYAKAYVKAHNLRNSTQLPAIEESEGD